MMCIVKDSHTNIQLSLNLVFGTILKSVQQNQKIAERLIDITFIIEKVDITTETTVTLIITNDSTLIHSKIRKIKNIDVD